MADLFGFNPLQAGFVDIRNQRDSVAEEEAELCKLLNDLLHKIPKGINSASVNKVRQFKKDHARCLKVLSSRRSSRSELLGAIESMRAYD